jgi:hypothetical protein
MLNRILLLSVVSMLAAAPTVAAQAGAAERFTFSPADAPKTGLQEGRLPLVITRWSTDAERDKVFQALSKQNDPQALSDALGSTPNVGYLQWPGGLEYAVRYARRTPRPGGGEDVTLIVDRAVWVWWKPEASLHASGSPYTIVQLRFDAKGGEGKLAPLAGAAADKQQGVIVADFAKPPALITDVRRDQRS